MREQTTAQADGVYPCVPGCATDPAETGYKEIVLAFSDWLVGSEGMDGRYEVTRAFNFFVLVYLLLLQ